MPKAPKRARQGELEGIEQKVDPKVTAAAEFYEDQRDKRMGWTKKEKVAKDALIEACRDAGLKMYRDDTAVPPIVVIVSTKDTVKVERVKAESDDDHTEDLN